MNLWFCREHDHWKRDTDSEVSRRLNPRGMELFSGWHNLETLALPPGDLVSLYVLVPPWRGEYKVLCVLPILIPSLFSHYNDYICVARCSSRKSSPKLRSPIISSLVSFHFLHLQEIDQLKRDVVMVVCRIMSSLG